MKPVSTALSLRRLLFTTMFMLAPLAPAAAGSASDLVDKNWIEIDSPNFRVVTEQPEDVARQMIVDLENLRYISNRVRGTQSLDGPPLTIVAIGKDSFATLGLPRNLAGVFTLSRAGYAALANLGVRHLSEPFREDLMRQTGGAVAVGGRDRHSMIYFGQSRNGLALGVQLDVGSRVPIATTAMGRAYIWALPPDDRAALLRELRDHYGSRWAKMRDGIERSGETVAKHGFTMSTGDWQNDVAAVGVALRLNDGTGPYAFNCGAPAFRFTEDRLLNDIGPRLVAMVRNIEQALGGIAPQSKKEQSKKSRVGGKVARLAEGIR